MGIKEMVEKEWCDETMYQMIIDTTWTEAQKELLDKGDEADDYGLEMVNYEWKKRRLA